MKTRSIIMVFILALSGGVMAHAQSLGATQITLKLDGQTFGGTLVPPTGAVAGYTWTLPAQSGTIALSSTGGWLVGGQGILPTNPGLLGSTDNANVSLIAGGLTNVRLTLRSDSTLVQTGDTTTFRFRDSADGQYVGLRAPNNIKGDYTMVWPDSTPAGNDVRLQVDTIIGNRVYLKWSNPNTTGSIGYKQAGQISTTQGPNTATDWTNVEGLNFSIGPNSIYSFESLIELTGVANQGIKLRFGVPFALGAKGAYTAVAGTTIRYYVITLTENNIVGFGNQVGNADTPNNGLITGEHYVIKGFIETDNTTPANSVVQLLMLREDASEVTVTSKSSVQLITE